MYKVTLSKNAARELSKLNRELASRFVALLSRINITPYDYMRKLSGTDLYRLRVGDYRAIIKIDDEKKELLVLKIGHRKNIYDWLG